MKRYPEPMAHGPEAHAEAVDTGCQWDIPVLQPAKSVKYPISTAISNCREIAAVAPPVVACSVDCIR